MQAAVVAVHRLYGQQSLLFRFLPLFTNACEEQLKETYRFDQPGGLLSPPRHLSDHIHSTGTAVLVARKPGKQQ